MNTGKLVFAQVMAHLPLTTVRRRAGLGFLDRPISDKSHRTIRQPRRNHSPQSKAKVALAGWRGEHTLVELAGHFKVPPNQITTCRCD